MSITLVNPPEQLRIWCGIPKAAAAGVYNFPPLGLMYLQASLEKRTSMRAEIFDPTVGALDYPDVEKRMRDYDWDLVGISTFTHALPDVAMMIRLIRKYNPNAQIILGGPHCSMFPEFAVRLEGIKGIVVGDGEDAFVEIAQALDQGKSLKGIKGVWFWEDGQLIRNPPRPYKKNLSSYPWPDRSRVDYKRYYLPGTRQRHTTIAVTSRGCPHTCPFCLAEKGSYRVRELEDILDEVEHCLSLGIKDIQFVDDLFNPNEKFVLDFADAVERRGLKFDYGYKTTIAGTTKRQIKRSRESGCYKICFGVETANNEGLEGYNKSCTTTDMKRVFRWCREEKLNSVSYIMLGGPHEKSREEVLANLDKAIDLDPDFMVIALFSPYPGTPSFHQGVQKGLFEKDCWDKMMLDPLGGHEVPLVWEEHLSKEELLDLLKIAHRRFYFRPSWLLRNGFPSTPWEFLRYLGGFKSILKMELLRPGQHEAPV